MSELAHYLAIPRPACKESLPCWRVRESLRKVETEPELTLGLGKPHLRIATCAAFSTTVNRSARNLARLRQKTLSTYLCWTREKALRPTTAKPVICGQSMRLPQPPRIFLRFP